MINYIPVKRRNPVDASVKYYAQNHPDPLVTTRELIGEIVAETTVTEADALAVVSAYVESMQVHLINGNSCKIEGLGIFSVTLGSEGTETAEEFKSSMINDVRLRFRADSRLKYELSLDNPEISFKNLMENV